MESNHNFFSGFGTGIGLFAFVYLVYKALRLLKTMCSPDEPPEAAQPPVTEYKVVMLLRGDLELTKGVIAKQCSHIIALAFEECYDKEPQVLKQWQSKGQRTTILRTSSLHEFKKIMMKARNLGLITTLVNENGPTEEFNEDVQVLGIGPAPVDILNRHTSHFRVLN